MSIIRFGAPLATPKQVKFINDLFFELNFESHQVRMYLDDGYGKKYADELTKDQASSLIDILIAQRDQKRIDENGGVKF